MTVKQTTAQSNQRTEEQTEQLMDSLTFRRKLHTDPQYLDEEMLEYLINHPSDKELVKQARYFDQQLTNALDVEVPQDLQAKILLKQNMLVEAALKQTSEEDSVQERYDNSETSSAVNARKEKGGVTQWHNSLWSKLTPKPVYSAIAASVFMVGFGWLLMVNNHHHEPIDGDDIVGHVLEHLTHEPGLLDRLLMPDTEQEMQNLFASVGAKLDYAIEGMKYAGICDISGQDGLHIVMQQDNQPVTIIVMPGQQLEARQAFEKSGYKGELVPVKGGMVAIVGDTMDQIALAQIRFFRAVRFV